MKNANGTGTIYKLKKNLRKPYIAKAPATYGKENDNPKQKVIGYFATKKEAMIALADYLKTPYNIDSSTVDDVFDKILARMTISENSKKNVTSVYNKYFVSVKNVRLLDLKLSILQAVLDTVTASHSMALWCAKIIANYAFEYEFVQRPFADFLICKKPASTREKTIYTKEEILALHNHDLSIGTLERASGYSNRANGGFTDYNEYDDAFLCYLYTGCRLEELLSLKKENVFIDGTTVSSIPHIITGEKTEAGKNRVIPVHPRIIDIIKNYIAESDDKEGYMFPDRIRRYFAAAGSRDFHIKRRFKTKHCLHETRHTFRTELDRIESNITNINKLMGHTGGHIGQKVYTHKTIEDLYDTIKKVTFNIDNDELVKNG